MAKQNRLISTIFQNKASKVRNKTLKHLKIFVSDSIAFPFNSVQMDKRAIKLFLGIMITYVMVSYRNPGDINL